MKTPYTLSTDYAELFRLIQDGTHYLGIVGYKHENRDWPATVYKHNAGYWIASEHIVRFLSAKDKPTLEDFERICKQTNLRWIKP